jgi:hypothetical protein
MYKEDFDYKLAGACTFLSDETLKIMGYNKYLNLFPDRNNPILVYSKTGQLDGILFGELNEIKKHIHPEIIKDLYRIKEAQNLFPELFI